jgi:NADH-quinone oxidoreductase subunit C
MDAKAIAEKLGKATSHEQRHDGLWLTIPDLDVRAMAQLMIDNESRFVTMTALLDGGGLRFIYHWDVDGALLNVSMPIVNNVAMSIADILPAADWIEREARDYYAVTFEGRSETPPLMLLDDDEPGLFSRTADTCRDADPADIGWSPSAPESGGDE